MKFAILPALALFQVMTIGQPAPVRIGLSKATENYVNWIHRADPSIETVDLYALPVPDAVLELSRCSGLLLTGGEDVTPGRYGKAYDTARCTEMNPHRDSLDYALIEKALSLKMPVVGICRGSQILNVYLGGTLVVDIPGDIGKRVTHQCEEFLRCYHMVGTIRPSLLASICKCDSVVVTTNHHQAVDGLAPALITNAASADGLTEGIEWREKEGKSFLLGVQWHPERMDTSNPLSGPLADEFIRQAILFSLKKP